MILFVAGRYGSDVSVLENKGIYSCSQCKLKRHNRGTLVTFGSAEAMLDHLRAHIKQGDVVPSSLIEYLYKISDIEDGDNDLP